jgi:hypothetical protein
MKWFIVSALLLLSLSLTLSAQDANKNPNKKEPPLLGPHWERATASTRACGRQSRHDLPWRTDFAERHRESHFLG